MQRKFKIFIIFFSFLMALNFVSIDVLTAKEQTSSKDQLYEELELYADALTIIQSEYVDEVRPKDLIYGSLRGMLKSLDTHSQFLDPDEYNEVRVETGGEFGGIGIEITISKDGLLTVIAPIDDTPAYKAGLKANDKIVKINGEVTKDITLLEAVKKLRGKPGTKVTVTIMREGQDKLQDYTITRDIIKIKSIKEAKIIKDNIAYIRLSEFQENTPKDLDAALKNLKKESMDSLILDLRDNPGGLLSVSVDVAERFLPKGEVVVSTRSRVKSQNLEFKSRDGNYLDFPMVVLVDSGSASASEIVAGALQDNKRAIIIGTKTFGKGSVQTVIPLKDGSALRLTTSKYFTPLGKSIHGEGITPDIVTERQETKVLEEQKTAKEVFEKIEKEQRPDEQKPQQTEKPIIYDNQLEGAIDILKAIKVYVNSRI